MTDTMNYVLENSDNFTDKELELIANAYDSGRSIYLRNQYHGGR